MLRDIGEVARDAGCGPSDFLLASDWRIQLRRDPVPNRPSKEGTDVASDIYAACFRVAAFFATRLRRPIWKIASTIPARIV